MRKRLARLVAIHAALIVGLAAFANAADLTKATTDAEGRRRAAENGARAIRARAASQAEQVKDLYLASAAAHNAWLDATRTQVEKSEGDGAVSEAASRAASALVKWVAARNQALGEPVLSGRTADSIEASIRQGLIDISVESARRQRGASQDKKRQVLAELSNRLRWKDWNEL